MIAFEVSVNGEKKCVAGAEDADVLSTMIDGPRAPRLRVGGLVGDDHVDWLKSDIKAGDEITIRLVETASADQPSGHSRSQTRAEQENEVKTHLEQARVLLPETSDAALANYRQCLENRHWLGAMDALERVGNESGAGALFWRELGHAAGGQSSYEDSKRFHKRWKAIQAAIAPDAPKAD